MSFVTSLEQGEVPQSLSGLTEAEENDQELKLLISDFRPLNFLTPGSHELQEKLNKVLIRKIEGPKVVLNKNIKPPAIDPDLEVSKIKIRYITGESLGFEANSRLKIRELFEYVSR